MGQTLPLLTMLEGNEGLTIKPVCATRRAHGAVAAEFGGEVNFKVEDLLAFRAWLSSVILEALRGRCPCGEGDFFFF